MKSRANKGLKGEIEAPALLEWIKEPNNVWLYAFCAHRGYSRDAGDDLKNRSLEFKQAWNIAKCITLSRVLSGALFNKMNPWIAKWYLSTNFTKDFPKEHDTTQFGGNVAGLMDKIAKQYAPEKKE